MKEIYKIPKGQNVSTEKGVKYIDNEIKTFFYEVEQVPETWEELKSLCKDIKDIQIVSNVIYLEPEDLGRIELYSDGVIVCNEYILAENRTVAQMWNFIKSLMEKEDVLL